MVQVTRLESAARSDVVRSDAPERAWRQPLEPHRFLGAEVLSRQRFLEHLYIEKRRADRSRAALSVVVARFAPEGTLDSDDLRELLAAVSRSTRETDIVGHLGNGIVAFLLPYSRQGDAEAFAALVVGRVGAPALSVEVATYTEPRFDSLLDDALAAAGNWFPMSASYAGGKSRLALTAKRVLDVVGSLALLVICAPLMLLTAVAIKASSRGPILFKQVRIGRDGVPFEFLKFRSMRVGSDEGVHREYVSRFIAGDHAANQGAAEQPRYKLRSDPRVTPIGGILRKTSIDELPQLFNVLKGEMSLVGPRPPIRYEAEQYQSWHMRRLQEVRPGMTGLWQVEGRSRTTFDEMVRLDLRYIRNWSLLLDLKILLRTVLVVARCDGAE